jgi:hypothetical protein
MKLFKILILLMLCCNLFAQPSCIYKLNGDSVNVRTLTLQKPLVLVYYSDKSCYDCFDIINNFFEHDSTKVLLFVIEKTNSPLLNFEIRKKLMKKGITESKIFFSLDVTHNISPYVDLVKEKSSKRLPYAMIFDDSKDFIVSDKFKKIVELFYSEPNE